MNFQKIDIELRPKGKPLHGLPMTLCVPATATVRDVYKHAAQKLKCSVDRIRIAKGSSNDTSSYIQNSTTELIGMYDDLQDQKVLWVKDLGPQIGWRTVYVLEYLGPILIHPLIFFWRPNSYHGISAAESVSPMSNVPVRSHAQTLTLVLVLLHYAKRELETVFVHTFSSATMPARNLFKNSFHYWVLGGLNIAFWNYWSPLFTKFSPIHWVEDWILTLLLPVGLILWTVSELFNLYIHVMLRLLRNSSAGENSSAQRKVPTAPGFGFVTCPHYFAEVMSWVGVYFVSGLSWSVLLFTLVSALQMMLWARKREDRYRKAFGSNYRWKRFSMIPGIW